MSFKGGGGGQKSRKKCWRNLWTVPLYIVKDCTRAIITRSLYIFYPIFEDHFFVFKDIFSENSGLIYG